MIDNRGGYSRFWPVLSLLAAGIALPGTLARHLDIASTVRGFMLVWPRNGEPVVVLDSFAEKVVARDSWVGKTVVYKAYVESLYTRVANLLDDLGLSRAHVGFEMDGLSASHWNLADAPGPAPIGNRSNRPPITL